MRQGERGHVGVRVGVHPEDSLLIIINHCREMKQQEARLRLATLLLILSCAAIFVFLNCARFTKVTSVSDPAFSALKDPCPAGNPSRTEPPTTRPLRVALRSVSNPNLTSGSVLEWEDEIRDDGGAYNKERRAIVIPARGHYFVYMKFMLLLRERNEDFYVKLQSWNERYPDNLNLTFVRESGIHSQNGFRTVYVGQLFDLFEGDHLRVFLIQGHELIDIASFGAFET